MLYCPLHIGLSGTKPHLADWEICSPETAGDFSGVAYFYARELYQKLNVPIGIINASWGGTDIETWISSESYNKLPEAVKRQYNPDVIKNFDTYIKQNTGNKQAFLSAMKSDPAIQAVWYDPNFDTSTWDNIEVPGEWSRTQLSLIDGHIWFKYNITLSSEIKGKAAIISLGTIDDSEITWINGEKIGKSSGWDTPRLYKIPSGILKDGVNNITVRITDNGGSGGMWSPSKDLYLEIQDDQKSRFPLAGEWQYKGSVTNAQYHILDITPNMFNSSLFNTMINPITKLRIKGSVWYQGENNVGAAYNYRTLFPTMINDWRDKWGYEFPFYWVQLANLYPLDQTPAESTWAELREAQSMTLRLPNTGQAVICDIGNPNSIHPTNKQDVGKRLALIAFNTTYGKSSCICSGPTYEFMEIEGNKATITMDSHGSKLAIKDKYGYLTGFTIAGEDKKFEWAKAFLDGDKIIVYSEKISKPVAVRYGWANNPGGNLINKADLPAPPLQNRYLERHDREEIINNRKK